MTAASRHYDTAVSGDTERLVREFCAWLEARGHDATIAECERIARELLTVSGVGLSQADVDAHCAKLKRGFAGGRTILATSEVGEALVEWLQTSGAADAGAAAPAPAATLDIDEGFGAPSTEMDFDVEDVPAAEPPPPEPAAGLPGGFSDDDRPLDELSWGEDAGDDLLAGVDADDLPPNRWGRISRRYRASTAVRRWQRRPWTSTSQTCFRSTIGSTRSAAVTSSPHPIRLRPTST